MSKTQTSQKLATKQVESSSVSTPISATVAAKPKAKASKASTVATATVTPVAPVAPVVEKTVVVAKTPKVYKEGTVGFLRQEVHKAGLHIGSDYKSGIVIRRLLFSLALMILFFLL